MNWFEIHALQRHYRCGDWRITVEPISIKGGSIARLIYQGRMVDAQRFPDKPANSWTNEDMTAMALKHGGPNAIETRNDRQPTTPRW